MVATSGMLNSSITGDPSPARVFGDWKHASRIRRVGHGVQGDPVRGQQHGPDLGGVAVVLLGPQRGQHPGRGVRQGVGAAGGRGHGSSQAGTTDNQAPESAIYRGWGKYFQKVSDRRAPPSPAGHGAGLGFVTALTRLLNHRGSRRHMTRLLNHRGQAMVGSASQDQLGNSPSHRRTARPSRRRAPRPRRRRPRWRRRPPERRRLGRRRAQARPRP